MHRIDAQTSGIVIFGKTAEAANEFTDELKKKEVHKAYFALAKGCVKQEGKFEVNYRIYYGLSKDCLHASVLPPEEESSGYAGSHEDEEEAKRRIKEAKDARTIIKKVHYDEESDRTLLKCYPVTGRTH